MNELWDLARSVAARVSIHLVGARFLETVLTLVAFVVVVELLTRRRWAGRRRSGSARRSRAASWPSSWC